MSQSRRRAFTLIELLVVVVILALLMALMVPAVQQTREAARQSLCKNNLKQFGLALHNYHDVNATFPPGWIGIAGKHHSVGGDNGFAWGTMLLPYLEQVTLYSQFDFDRNMDDEPNRSLLKQPVKVFVCPTTPQPDTFQTLDRNSNLIELATANYSGVFGSGLLSDCANPAGTAPVTAQGQCVGDGVFYHDSKIRLALLVDGVSVTFLLGERRHFMTSDGETIYGTWSGALPRNSHPRLRVLGNCGIQLNNVQNPRNFGSFHVPGGAHFLLADGHVIFVSATIDQSLYAALATRAGGELITEF